MSAILGVCGSEAGHLLTDAATTGVKDGTLLAIHRKQIINTRGAGFVIAGVGLWGPCVRLARLADERGADNLDALADLAPSLWEEARATLTAKEKAVPCAVLFAGWSNKDACVRMDLLQEVGDGSFAMCDDLSEKLGDASGFLPDQIVYAGGADDACGELLDPLVKRIGADPDHFDPRQDGISFMEEMRRIPRKFELTQLPAVGGFVTHTVIRREHIDTRIIHHWPDRVGRPIDLARDDSTTGDFFKVCDVLAAQMKAEADRIDAQGPK